eukprot:scaffold45007_cov59-Phaeocystis_antarctica.AAC.10
MARWSLKSRAVQGLFVVSYSTTSVFSLSKLKRLSLKKAPKASFRGSVAHPSRESHARGCNPADISPSPLPVWVARIRTRFKIVVHCLLYSVDLYRCSSPPKGDADVRRNRRVTGESPESHPESHRRARLPPPNAAAKSSG